MMLPPLPLLQPRLLVLVEALQLLLRQPLRRLLVRADKKLLLLQLRRRLPLLLVVTMAIMAMARGETAAVTTRDVKSPIPFGTTRNPTAPATVVGRLNLVHTLNPSASKSKSRLKRHRLPKCVL
jgi:hypothetical protein